MKVASLISGGKDSLFALFLTLEQGWDVPYVISIFPKNPESFMFHYPNIKLTKLQAESIGIPLITKKTEAKKEEELADLEFVLKSIKGEVEGVVSGALFSEYQKQRIDMICEKLGLKSFAPLWHKNPELTWNDLLNSKFVIMMTAVAADGLDERWLGRIIDKKAFSELRELSKKYKFNLAGEGGEFETLVLDCPLFKKRLKIIEAEKKWNKDSGVYVIKKAVLV